MPDQKIFVPMSRKLYNDIVRFSSGKLDPAGIAENLLLSWIEKSLESGSREHWGDCYEDVISEYAPHLLNHIAAGTEAAIEKALFEARPLAWEGASIRAGSDVRIFYNGGYRYAKVYGGSILDTDGGSYLPSEWASKITGNGACDAWSDLWFREPLSTVWVPATLYRDQAREEARAISKSDVSRRNEG